MTLQKGTAMFIALILAFVLTVVLAVLHALTAPLVEAQMRQYEFDMEQRYREAKNR